MKGPSAALTAWLLFAAGPVAAFDGIRLTLLGASSPAAGGPSTLVEAGAEVFLFDCGAGTLAQLRRARVRLGEITAMFLSGLDAAHTEGCGELLGARRAAALEEPLLLWGPPGTIQAVRDWAAGQIADGPGGIYPYEIDENIIYQSADVRVTAIVADDSPERHAFGYRVDRERRAIALLAGARYSDNVAQNARGVQVLAHEVAAADPEQARSAATSRDAPADLSSPEDAGKLFRAARPYLALYSHVRLLGVSEEDLVRRTRRHYRGPLQIGHELMVVEVQNEVQIRSTPSDGPRGQ
jgi:ribonuclease Z